MNRRSAEERVTALKMTWTWPSTRSGTVLTDCASTADNRLKAIKRAAKTLKKSVEDSLRTSSRSKNEELELRKKRSTEFVLGENIATAVHSLTADGKINEQCSPLNTVMERYANFEMTIGHMLAANELEITTFLGSDTPLSKLLNEDIPAVTAAKKELDQLTRKHLSAQNALDKETKKLEKMFTEEEVDHEVLRQQEEKTKRLLHEVDTLTKDVSLDQDKLTSTLLTLVSRENRYAGSILELMRIKKQFYANAFNTISAELPNIERILQETQVRPMFGEPLEDHLAATGRTIAFPIALAVTFLRETGLTDEGLFRISTQQIKLDKLKAYIDANLPFLQLLQDCDGHLFAALLKSYLRELPVPLLGRRQNHVHDRWIAVTNLPTEEARIREIRYILKEELPPSVVVNIQYMVKFLAELTRKSKTNKMTPGNLGIVLGPTLMWRTGGGAACEQSNIERVIKAVAILVEHYNDIFPVDISWAQYDEGVIELVQAINELPADAESLEAMEAEFSPDHRRSVTPQAGEASNRYKRNTLRTKLFSKINSTFDNSETTGASKESSPQ